MTSWKQRTMAALVAITIVVGLGTANRTMAATRITAPGQATSGFGSTQGYISTGATKYVTGDGNAGTRVWWYVPTTLRDRTTAPVIVYLHGFELLAPEIYQGHIDHLTRQGYIVIYPQINKGGIVGLISDTDQNQMMKRAIDATNVALGRLGPKADRGNVHLFGHSLGGLLGGAWTGSGGPAVKSITLANPSLNPAGSIPSFVSSLITIKPIDHATAARANTARAVIITGDKDTIASPTESTQYYGELVNTSDKVVYQAASDAHGTTPLVADHMAAIQDQGLVPDFMMQLFGGVGRQDTLDYRVYYAALDANIAGTTHLPFAMGTWSDGAAVKAPTQLAG